MTIQNVVGKPVSDLDFFGRDDEVERLIEEAATQHILLLAPRRVGKTSLLLEIAKRVERSGDAIGVYVSVASAATESVFVEALLEAIYKTKRGRKLKPGVVARLFGRRRAVKSIRVAGAEVAMESETPRWQEEASRAFDAIATSKVPVLLLIDELPILILAIASSDPSGQRVRLFLQWFRDLRQRTSNVQFVLAGSIGLDNVTRHHQLTETINDLQVEHLGPYARLVADAFLLALARATSSSCPWRCSMRSASRRDG